MNLKSFQVPTRVADRLPDAISNRLPVASRPSMLQRVRKPLGIAGIIAGVGLVGGVAKLVLDTRYRIGAAVLHCITEGPDNGIIVQLYGRTFWAPGEQREAFQSLADKHMLVPYRIDTWARRHDGLLTGCIGESTQLVPTSIED